VLDVYRRVNCSAHMAAKITGRPIEDILLGAWADRDCRQWATEGHAAAELGELPLMIDFSAFVTFIFATGFSMDLIRKIPVHLLARHEFVLQLDHLWQSFSAKPSTTGFSPTEMLKTV